ncbi:MAG: hypothetical protein HYY17_13255 [Planctomycetes bacterium]|nr:hypothetical protein [Planctomycetota bacterium]
MVIEEGGQVSVPCRHCRSLSIQVAVEAGTRPYSCKRCSRSTQVAIVKAGRAWSVYTARLESAVAVE